jgi:nucleoside-diphosphate-sugar epimerase
MRGGFLMKSLVTGGAGFIGSNLVRLLISKNVEVVVLDNLSTGRIDNLSGLNTEFVEGDIRDKDLVIKASKGADVIFHLAASVGRQKSIENPQEDSLVNIMGTLNIIEAARKNLIPKIVFSSSAAVYGELLTSTIDEEHPQNPDSPYGVSKLAAEKHLMVSSDLFGLTTICLRYFNVFGINQRFDAYGNVIPIFAHNVLNKEPIIIFGDGSQTRDFVNVDDVVLVNYLAAINAKRSSIYNIGSGYSITIGKLANLVKRMSRIEVELQYAPRRKGDVLHCKANIEKAREELGFNPSTDFETELNNYISWFKQDYSI